MAEAVAPCLEIKLPNQGKLSTVGSQSSCPLSILYLVASVEEGILPTISNLKQIFNIVTNDQIWFERGI